MFGQDYWSHLNKCHQHKCGLDNWWEDRCNLCKWSQESYKLVWQVWFRTNLKFLICGYLNKCQWDIVAWTIVARTVVTGPNSYRDLISFHAKFEQDMISYNEVLLILTVYNKFQTFCPLNHPNLQVLEGTSPLKTKVCTVLPGRHCSPFHGEKTNNLFWPDTIVKHQCQAENTFGLNYIIEISIPWCGFGKGKKREIKWNFPQSALPPPKSEGKTKRKLGLSCAMLSSDKNSWVDGQLSFGQWVPNIIKDGFKKRIMIIIMKKKNSVLKLFNLPEIHFRSTFFPLDYDYPPHTHTLRSDVTLNS